MTRSHRPVLTPGFLPALMLLPLVAAMPVGAKQAATYYTPERLATIRYNCATYAWAAKQRDETLEAAEPWMALSDEQLWEMVPAQSVPRHHTVNKEIGCPVCRKEGHARDEWEYDIFERPWKVRCRVCGTVFPSNDFGAYHQSGLNEHGVFDPERADRSLLFNAEHPDADDALHTEYVDDGLGWVDADGARFWFVAPYVEWGLWRRLGAAVSILSWSYAYTGEQRYAHKAAVLLDRIADLYPDMDKAYWLPDNMKGTGGKILDSVWENGFLGGNVIYPYDIIHDAIGQDDELVAFLSAQAARYILPNPKASADLSRANIDHNLVREMLLSMEEGVIDGNVGMCERSVAYCGIALGDTPEVRHALEWVFSDEGNALARTMVEAIDRDGVGAESSPGYSLSWCSNLGYFATLLHDYGEAPPEYDLMRHPKFSRMMEAAVRLVCLDRFTPNIGDCGSTGKLETVIPQTELLVKLFLASKNPAVAKAIYFKTDGNLAGLHYPVTEPDPERVREEITRIARPAPNEDFTSENLAGYGLCKLQSGRRSDDSGRCLWVSYGRNGGAHPHQDRLGTGLVAKGIDLSPEMGYPEFTGGWPKRRYWTDVSISHNTVTVDTQAQLSSFCGGVGFFKASGDIDVVDLTSPQIYDQCDRFDRQISLIDVSPEDSYVVDVFAVRGGKDHIYSYHGPEGPVTVDGLQLVTQKAGTYAGPEFAYPERGLGPRPGAPGMLQYLDTVQRDTVPPDVFSVDWDAIDTWGYHGKTERDVHLKLHMLGRHGEVALARGYPPNKPGHPEWLQYVLVRNQGEGPIESTFVSVLEPYENTPILKRVERRNMGPGPAVGLEIETTNGATDYVCTATGSLNDQPQTLALGETLTVRGDYAFVRFRDDILTRLLLVNATSFNGRGVEVVLDRAAWRGSVVQMDRQMDEDNTITVTPALPSDGTLDGEWIIIDNDGERNAAYQIARVRPAGDERSLVSLGNVTFIREMAHERPLRIADEAQWSGADFIAQLDALGVDYRSIEPESLWDGGAGGPVVSNEARSVGELLGGRGLRARVKGCFVFSLGDLPAGAYDLWVLGNAPEYGSRVSVRFQDERGVMDGCRMPATPIKEMATTHWYRVLDTLEVIDDRPVRLRIWDSSGTGGVDTLLDEFVLVPHGTPVPVKSTDADAAADGTAVAPGYTYNFEVGADFVIPGHFSMAATESGDYDIHSTSAFSIRMPDASVLAVGHAQLQAGPGNPMPVPLSAMDAGRIRLRVTPAEG